MHTAVAGIVGLPKPVLACVHGQAYGAGFSLALACDMVIAAEDAVFCQAFVRVGTSPDSGSTYFLPRILGRQLATELVMLGEPVSAAEAKRLGLVNRVVSREQLEAEVGGLAARLAQGPAGAHARAKYLLTTGARAGLEDHLAQERRCLGESAATADFRAGVEAFVSRTPARFGTPAP